MIKRLILISVLTLLLSISFGSISIFANGSIIIAEAPTPTPETTPEKTPAPPTITLLSPKENFSTQMYQSINISAVGTNCTRLSIYVNNYEQLWTTRNECSFNYTFLFGGEYTIYAVASNGSVKVESPRIKVSVAYATPIPTPVVTPSPTPNPNELSVRFTSPKYFERGYMSEGFTYFSAEGTKCSEVTIYINGQPFTSKGNRCSFYVATGYSPYSPFTFSAEATDGVEKVSTPKYQVHILEATPMPTATAPPNVKIVVGLIVGSNELSIEKSGQTKKDILDSAPVIKENRVFLPIRKIIEVFGGKVNWYPDTQKVIIGNGKTSITLTIGKSKAIVNGKEVSIDSADNSIVPYISPEGRTMLPLRFVSENLGAELSWDGITQTVSITGYIPPIFRDVKAEWVYDDTSTIHNTTAMKISWVTDNSKGSIIMYGNGIVCQFSVGGTTTELPDGEGYLHSVILYGLTPDRGYTVFCGGWYKFSFTAVSR